MSAVLAFLTRRQGRGRLTLADRVSYAYLMLGLLVILMPVLWLALNSVKTAFQIEKQDLSLLPGDFERVARATVNGPDGRESFVIGDLPEWVLGWKRLGSEERAAHDVTGFLAGLSGRTLYALRSHLDQVPAEARRLIAEKGLPEWLNRYSSIAGQARDAFDPEAALAGLTGEEERLIKEYLGIDPYKPNRLVTQVRVTAPHPDTGEVMAWAVPNLSGRAEVVPARAVDGSIEGVVRLPKDSVTASRRIAPAWENYTDPLTGNAYGVNVDFATCITNSVLVTVIATLLTLLINSMAGFALSKYRFRGQMLFLAVILATLMVPVTITLVGVFKAIHATGLSGSIWGSSSPARPRPPVSSCSGSTC